MLLFFFNLLNLVYLIQYQPYTDNSANRMEIFNEVCLLIASYYMIIFSDFVDDPELMVNFGWSLDLLVLL